MSSLVQPRSRQQRVPSRSAALRLVAPVRARARRAPFVVVVMMLLSAGLVGLILLSTVLQAQAFEGARLSREAAALETQQQELAREVETLNSPSSLARKGLALGMVPNANPVFLRLSDGEVIGTPEPALPKSNVRRVDW